MSRSRSSSIASSSDPIISSASAVEPLGDLVARGVEAGVPADAVDRLEAAGGHQPRPRVPWHAVARPLLGGGDEGVVERLLGALEIAEKADQRRENAARFGAIDRGDRLARRRR